MGPNGAGHYVKMVHNGIEYGDMQLICESLHPCSSRSAGLTNAELCKVFSEWNQGDLDSYLIEITSRDLRHQKDDRDAEGDLVDVILDTRRRRRAPASGRARTRSTSACRRTLIAEAVFARCLSALKRRARRGLEARGWRARGAAAQGPSARALIAVSARRALPQKICRYAARLPAADARAARKITSGPSTSADDRVDLPRRLHHPRALPAEDHRAYTMTRTSRICCSIPYFRDIARQR